MLFNYSATRNGTPSSSSSSRSSSKSKVIPPGTPYLTKINGKLVIARNKKEKVLNCPTKILDILGEVFEGHKTRVFRRRKSVDESKQLLLIDGDLYIPAQLLHPELPSPPFTPITQQLCPVTNIPTPWYPQYVPQLYPSQYPLCPPFTPVLQAHLPQSSPHLLSSLTTLEPSRKVFDHMKSVDPPIHHEFERGPMKTEPRAHTAGSATPLTMTKMMVLEYICSNCGKVRSRKYQYLNPIKQGEVPVATFCGKCKRDAFSTSTEGPNDLVFRNENKEHTTQVKDPICRKEQYEVRISQFSFPNKC